MGSLKIDTGKLSWLVKIICLSGLLLCAGTVAADETPVTSEYHLGLDDFVGGDYEGARAHWLKAARAGDALAMFNLGWMYQQRHISAGSEKHASAWLHHAAKKGYLPAYYHLAVTLLAKGENRAQARRLLLKAASYQFEPAIKLLQQEFGDRQFAEASTEPSLLNEAEAWILSQPSANWTVQLHRAGSEASLIQFKLDNNLGNEAQFYLEQDEDTPVFTLIYGSYATKSEASRARYLLRDDLKQQAPVLRSFNQIKQSIVFADEPGFGGSAN